MYYNTAGLSITATTLKSLVCLRKKNNLSITPMLYRCPSEQWLIDTVGDEYEQVAFDFGLRAYHQSDWDSDERAMLYCTVARGIHRNELSNPKCGLAVGLASYAPDCDKKREQAICWAIANRNCDPVLVFINPCEQPELIKLSQSELETLNRIYM